MAVEVQSPLKHNGVLYQVGQVIHNLEEKAKAELIHLGVVKDLEKDASTVGQQIRQDASTIAGQVHDDAQTVGQQVHDAEDLARGQVEDQVQAAAGQDVEDAKATLQADGQPVSQAGVQQPPAAPQQPAQPTPEQIANDPQLQQ